MRVRTLSLGILVLLAGMGVASGQTGGGYDLTWSTMDGGGGNSTGGGYELSGTIGQADAGELNGGSFELYGGYWYPGSLAAVTATWTLVLAGLNALMLMVGVWKLRTFSLGSWGRSAAI